MSDRLFRCKGGRIRAYPSSNDDPIHVLLSKDSRSWSKQCFECTEKESAFINTEKAIEMRDFCIWERVSASNDERLVMPDVI